MEGITSANLRISWSVMKLGMLCCGFISLVACQALHQDIDLIAAPDVNATSTQQGLSVRTQVYLLRNANALRELNFADFDRHLNPLHHSSVLASQQTLLQPGQRQRLSLPYQREARAVAVVALFHHPNQWRAIVPLNENFPNTLQNKIFDLQVNRVQVRQNANPHQLQRPIAMG